MLSRGGKAEPELVPNVLVLSKKEGGVVIVGPLTPRCGTLTLTKVLPEVQVRRWRRLSGRRFMTKSSSYSSLTVPPPPVHKVNTWAWPGICAPGRFLLDYVFHNAMR